MAATSAIDRPPRGSVHRCEPAQKFRRFTGHCSNQGGLHGLTSIDRAPIAGTTEGLGVISHERLPHSNEGTLCSHSGWPTGANHTVSTGRSSVRAQDPVSAVALSRCV
jgi:hypothetical protein